MTIEIHGRVGDVTSGCGLPDVVVSNGETLSRTDAAGRYALEVSPPAHRFVFLTVPDGYAPHICGDGFFRAINAGAGLPDRVDFELVAHPRRASRHFTFIHIADTHVDVNDQMPSGEMLAADLRCLVAAEAPDFMVAAGDLTNRGSLVELRAYRAAIAAAGAPVFSVFGGHDGNEERLSGKPDRTFARNYEAVLGPTYYSLDYGGRHFVFYPNEACSGTPADHDRKQRWLQSDLDFQPSGRENIVVTHGPPTADFLAQLRRYNVRLVLFGHWHSSKCYTQADIVIAAAPPFCFGGIDTTARGYRTIAFDDDTMRMELKALQPVTAAPPVAEGGVAIELDGRSPPLRPCWEHRWPTGFSRGTPVALADRILIGVADEGYRVPGGQRSGVQCLAAKTGALLWHAPADASIRNSVAVSAPAATGSTLWCAAVSITGRVYVIDAGSGRLAWSADLPGYPERWIFTAPVIHAETLFAGAKAGLAAYNLATGERKWHAALARNDAWSYYATPRAWRELLIALVPRRGLVALNQHDGTVRWEQMLPVEYYYATPAVSGNWIVSGGDPGCLVVLAADTGAILWHQAAFSAPYPTGLATDQDLIYVTTAAGEVQCCEMTTGRRCWTFATGPDLLDVTPYQRGGRSILAAPVLHAEHVLVGACDGWLYVLDRVSGKCQDRMFFGSPITATPCLAEQGLYVMTYDGYLRGFAF